MSKDYTEIELFFEGASSWAHCAVVIARKSQA